MKLNLVKSPTKINRCCEGEIAIHNYDLIYGLLNKRLQQWANNERRTVNRTRLKNTHSQAELILHLIKCCKQTSASWLALRSVTFSRPFPLPRQFCWALSSWHISDRYSRLIRSINSYLPNLSMGISPHGKEEKNLNSSTSLFESNKSY